MKGMDVMKGTKAMKPAELRQMRIAKFKGCSLNGSALNTRIEIFRRASRFDMIAQHFARTEVLWFCILVQCKRQGKR